MTVAHDAASELQFSTSDPAQFTHTPSGTPAGVIVWIGHRATTDRIAGVTYGGVAMTRVLSVVGVDRGYVYFLGASIPTGAQTVSVDSDGSAGSKHAVCATVTASGDTEITVTGNLTVGQADPQIAVDTSATSSLRYFGITSDLDTPTDLTLIADMTAIHDSDLGVASSLFARQTTAASGSVTVGWTAVTDDVAMIAVGIQEAAGGTTFQISVGGSITATGALTRKAKLSRAGTSTASGALTRRTGKTLTGSSAATGALTNRIRKLLTGSITPAGIATAIRKFIRNLAGAVTPAGSLLRRTRKTITASSTPTGAMSKRTGKLMAGSVTPSGSVAAIRKFIRNLTGSVAPSGAVRSKVAKGLGGSVTAAGAVGSRTRKQVSGSVTGSGALAVRRIVRRTFAGSITAVGTLTSQIVSGFVGWWRRAATAFTRNPVAYTSNPVDYDPAEGDQPSPF